MPTLTFMGIGGVLSAAAFMVRKTKATAQAAKDLQEESLSSP